MGLSTIIGWTNKDSSGHRLDDAMYISIRSIPRYVMLTQLFKLFSTLKIWQ
jgi:hypothetical protein